MNHAELMVTFEKRDLKLVALDGERYLTIRALALALDSKVRSLKKLVQEMKARDELKEGVHFKRIPVPTLGGPANYHPHHLQGCDPYSHAERLATGHTIPRLGGRGALFIDDERGSRGP